MWHAYNLIAVGDRVRATAVRKVQRETATGTVGAEKIKFGNDKISSNSG